MGTWGTELYQDDLAKEVRDRFKDQLRKGRTADEVTEELLAAYAREAGDPDSSAVFWFALADTQWDLACLLPQVKKEALRRLDKGGDIAKWEEEDLEQAAIRKEVLEKLKQKLSSPSPLKSKNRKTN